jgi:hypothetical protein
VHLISSLLFHFLSSTQQSKTERAATTATTPAELGVCGVRGAAASTVSGLVGGTEKSTMTGGLWVVDSDLGWAATVVR